MSSVNVQRAWEIFNTAIEHYHEVEELNIRPINPYNHPLEKLFWDKNWIDCIQWHTEDLIRDPEITPANALLLKRKIDALNQERTDLVEQLDDYFLEFFKNVKVLEDASLNTESPAWVFDRLSILALKIYHMEIEAYRNDISVEQKNRNQNKLSVLLEQKLDVCNALENLFQNIQQGKVKMKVYRQMKMYNDETLNPILYSKNS